MERQNPDKSKAASQSMGNFSARWQLLDLFSELSIRMGSFSDTDQLITFFVNRTAEIFKADRVSFMFLDRASEELTIKASCGLHPLANRIRVKLGQMFSGWVAQQGKPLLVKDIESEYPNLLKERFLRYKSKSFIIVPVKVKEKVFGVLNMTDGKGGNAFTLQDLKAVNLLCHFMALHIDNIKLSEKNSELITVDTLTGLFNHRYFQEQLLEEIYHAERYRKPLSLLILDIDNFSDHNQAYGYSAGDSALKQVARIIKENTRRVDTVCRFGPEEFTVIFPNTRVKDSIAVSERIRETIACSIFAEKRTNSSGMARLTASIGLTEYKIGLTKAELIRQASNALLEAKQKGKNQVRSLK